MSTSGNHMTDEKHQDVKQAGGQSIPISGRFDQYRSSYWGAKLAAFGLRYPLRENMRSDWTQPDATFNKKPSLWPGNWVKRKMT